VGYSAAQGVDAQKNAELMKAQEMQIVGPKMQ